MDGHIKKKLFLSPISWDRQQYWHCNEHTIWITILLLLYHLQNTSRMRSTLIKCEWSDTKYCSHNYKEELILINFTKLTEHTVNFISVSNRWKNCTVIGYETQCVIFASYCEKYFTESRDKTDNMINYIETLKLPSVHATYVNIFYVRSNLTLAFQPYWPNMNCLLDYSDCGVLCMDPV